MLEEYLKYDISTNERITLTSDLNPLSSQPVGPWQAGAGGSIFIYNEKKNKINIYKRNIKYIYIFFWFLSKPKKIIYKSILS